MVNNSRWAWIAWLGLTWSALACEPKPETSLGFSGVVEFEQELLGFERSGRLVTRPVRRGEAVRAGQVLGTLDDSLDVAAQAAEAQSAAAAEAEVTLLRAAPKREDVAALARRVDAAKATEGKLAENYARDSQLAAKGVLPTAVATDLRAELERARAEREGLEEQLASLRRGARPAEVKAREARAEVARASLELQTEKLKKNELRAPSDGLIAEVYADPGEVVAPGAPVVGLVHRDHPLVSVFVPVGALAGLQPGHKANARVDAYSRVFSGEIEYISPSTEFTPRYIFSDQERPRLVVRVRVRLNDPEHALVEGVPAFVEFEKP